MWEKRGEGNDPVQPAVNTYLGERLSTPALEPRPQSWGPDLSTAPRAPAPDRAPGSGLAASAGRPGRGPRSQVRSLAPFPQTRGGASSQSSGARLPAPCPWPHEGHPERTEPAGGQGSEHSHCPGSDLSPGSRRTASTPRPLHTPRRDWEAERRWEGCQKGGHFRFLLRPDFVWLRGRKCSHADLHFS